MLVDGILIHVIAHHLIYTKLIEWLVGTSTCAGDKPLSCACVHFSAVVVLAVCSVYKFLLDF